MTSWVAIYPSKTWKFSINEERMGTTCSLCISFICKDYYLDCQITEVPPHIWGTGPKCTMGLAVEVRDWRWSPGGGLSGVLGQSSGWSSGTPGQSFLKVLGHLWSLASQSWGWGNKDISESQGFAILIPWITRCGLTGEGSGLGALNCKFLFCPLRGGVGRTKVTLGTHWVGSI